MIAGGLFWLLMLRPSNLPRREGTSHAAVGTKLSELKLQPLTGAGEPVNLSDLDGKVTLINFWGTWCPPCIAEFPHIVQIAEEFEEHKEFQFLSVSCGYDPSATVDELEESILAFMNSRDVAIPTYADPEVITRKALMRDAASKSFGYPTTVLLVRSGVIQAMWDNGYAPGLEKKIYIAVSALLIP